MKKREAMQFKKHQNPKRANTISRDREGLKSTGIREVVHHDLDDLAGSWVDDPAFDKALHDMDRVDMTFQT